MNAPLYIDTSAAAKFILDEAEGARLDSFLLDNQFTLVSSELIEIELVRAVSRKDPALKRLAREVLRAMILLPISTSVREAAGEIFPGRIKSLDAIHLSTALEIKSDLAGLLTYDNRMAELARESGIEALAPN